MKQIMDFANGKENAVEIFFVFLYMKLNVLGVTH
jgi:hypothetical protein